MSQFPIPEWAALIDDAQFTDPAQVQARAEAFESTIKWRNILEYAAGALAVGLFAALSIGAIAIGEYIFAAAGLFVAVCVMVVLWQLHKRGSHQPARLEMPCLDHLRSQYERQYHALRTVPVWYLGPVALGLAGFYAAFAFKFARVGGWMEAAEALWQPVLVTSAVFAGIWVLNALAARSLKRRIDQIDTLAR